MEEFGNGLWGGYTQLPFDPENGDLDMEIRVADAPKSCGENLGKFHSHKRLRIFMDLFKNRIM
jgi:hypothetical protein